MGQFKWATAKALFSGETGGLKIVAPLRRLPHVYWQLVLGFVRKGLFRKALQDRKWVKDIIGALTVQVLLDYLSVWNKLQMFMLDDATPDKVPWKWIQDHSFSTTSAYRAFFFGQYEVPGARIL